MKFGRINYHAIKEHLCGESFLTLKECKERVQTRLFSLYRDEFNISFYPRSKSEYKHIRAVQNVVRKEPYEEKNKTFFIKRGKRDAKYRNRRKRIAMPGNNYQMWGAHMSSNHKEIIDVFLRWLIRKKNYTQETAEQVVIRINEASEYALKLNKTSSHFFAITSSAEAASVKKELFSNQGFKEFNKKHKNRYYESVDQYISFLIKGPELVNNLSMVMSTKKDISLYTEVLSDKKFKPLVVALKKDNITTLEQMQQINIFRYLNKNELYLWEERLRIAEDLNRILGSRQEIEEKSQLLNVDNKNDKEDIEANNGFAVVDFTSNNNYAYTKPTKLVLRGITRKIRSWKDVLVQSCELLISIAPNVIKTLVEIPLTEDSIRIHFSLTKTGMFFPKKLSNGMWVETNYSATNTVRICYILCQKCGIPCEDLKIYCCKKNHTGVCDGPNPIDGDENVGRRGEKAEDEAIESFIRKSGVKPNTLDDIQKVVPGLTRVALSRILDASTQFVEISNGRYIHRSNIIDLDEAAETMLQIIMSQFEQFDGYTNIRLLYYAVRNDLSLFLNDNDFDNMENVYYLAKHLFSKESYGSTQFVFYGNMHIWEREPDYPKSLKGLMINYARDANGVITREECETYLEKIGSGQKNTNQILRISQEPTFFQYDEGRYLLSETIPIDDSWIAQLTCCLDELLDVVQYVIPRDIRSGWFNKLPTLPFNLKWTPLLLQEILAYYSDIGFRTIPALFGQALDTLHAAIVRMDSQLQSFADVVCVYVRENMNLPQRMSAEELRLILRDAGMISGCELINNMHKALYDYRFAWSDGNKMVYIHGGVIYHTCMLDKR
jgi:hypothetical protein